MLISCPHCHRDIETGQAAPAHRLHGLVSVLEREIIYLNKEIHDWMFEFRLWRGAWLRHLGGHIVRKRHEIDGFGLRHEQQLKEEYERGLGDGKSAIACRDKWIEEVGKSLCGSAAPATAQLSEQLRQLPAKRFLPGDPCVLIDVEDVLALLRSQPAETKE